MRRLFIIAPPILVLTLYYYEVPQSESRSEEAQAIALTNVSVGENQEVRTTMSSSQKNQEAVPLKRTDLSLGTQNVAGLPRGMHFLPEVRVLASSDYRPEMGEKILEKNGSIYFTSTAWRDNYRPAVYDHRRDTLHPLASTIKVEGVDEELKEELSRTHEVYSYNEALGILHLQISPERLLADFQHLRNSGLSAQLEVADYRHQPK